jgi:hypothetical protein
MIDVNFDDYFYYPTLRTRSSEMKGLENLDQSRKSKILPLLTLGRWPKATDFTKSAEKAEFAMGGLPHFIDLTTDGNHLGDVQKALRNPTNAFSAWRDFVSQYENAIPIVQIITNTLVRDVTKQAQMLENTKRKIAFRIQDFLNDTPLVINAISALDDTKNAIVFIDCQYIRGATSAYITASISTINQLRKEFPELMIVLLSTSFPPSTVPFADSTKSRGSIDILERELHSRIGGSSVAIYGDHGSIHSVIYDAQPMMRWSARIDYPRELSWYFERRPGDQSVDGFISAAKDIIATDPDIGTRNIWGEQMIIDAANGRPFGRAPSSWIAVRVNIHLSRQLDFSSRIAESLDQDEDEIDGFEEE